MLRFMVKVLVKVW